MKRMKWMVLAGVTILLAAAASGVSAQGGPGGPPPPRGGFRGMGAGPMGPDDAFGFIGFEAGFSGKTVSGAPFTAEFSTETTESLPDGNRIDDKTTGSFARDSEGRTRREITLPAIGAFSTSANGGAPAHGIVINDPVAGVSYVLNENRKQARKSNLPSNQFRGNSPNRGPGPEARQNRNITTQSLGTQMIGGIAAEGTRTIRTIPAGQIGNEKPIEVTVDRWYSSDLQTDVMIKRSDPRGATTVFQLTNVVRSEPDSSLFQVPSDYSVVSRPAPGMRRGGMNQAPAQ
jgi:hypothetical protein